jgi:hypothetical protein
MQSDTQDNYYREDAADCDHIVRGQSFAASQFSTIFTASPQKRQSKEAANPAKIV